MNKYLVSVVVLMLTSGTLAKPTSLTDTEQMSAAETAQDVATVNTITGENTSEEEKVDVLIEVLRLPHPSPSARHYRSIGVAPAPKFSGSKTSSLEEPTTEESVSAEDSKDGKKVVVLVEIFKTPVEGDVEIAVRKQRYADDVTAAEEVGPNTASSIPTTTETSEVITELAKVSSEKPQDKKKNNSASGVKREASYDQKVHGDKLEAYDDDMSVAETIIFRPLFSYRQDNAARRRFFRDVSNARPELDYY